ncbi:hypothetical protein Gotri_028239 [Gossypium trilobum]|uniref:Leucine-rich repeat-containing N-terminal plant-type domain-containing protein n=1 Tax=Gossypium trilobum TaxID=34281 RepID=A0A7J9FKN6_9ROSI|nr:hypothetical protein [Gossypium trilobum]
MMESKWVWFMRMMVMRTLLLLEGCRWCTTNACLEQERIALLHLKPFFNSHYNDLRSWDEVKNLDCCEWKGVECNTTSKRLIGLSFYSEEWFQGEKLKDRYLNASLFLPFVELKRLYLSGNAIAGCVENEGFGKLSSTLNNLKILDLSYNYLNDSILLSLSELSSLRYLDLSYNRIEGSSHSRGFQWISRLTKLETLALSGNSLKNSVLLHMRNLSSLKTLRLSDNQLEGRLLHTQGLNNLINLRKLDLRGNQIESFQSFKDGDRKLKLTHLEELYLDSNLFNDSVFASLNKLSNLKYLSISGNQLKGSIDMKDLDAFTNLRTLDMSNNELKDIVIHKGII